MGITPLLRSYGRSDCPGAAGEAPFASRAVLSQGLSLLTSPTLPTPLSSTTPYAPARALFRSRFLFARICQSLDPLTPSREAKASSSVGPDCGFTSARKLAGRCGRIRFTFASFPCRIVTDGLFTSGSSPPRVATTQ